jgi:hypothetical protein
MDLKILEKIVSHQTMGLNPKEHCLRLAAVRKHAVTP